MFTFEVEGSGEFPIELLAAARCYPIDSANARSICDAHKRVIRLSSNISQTRMVWFFRGWKIISGIVLEEDDHNGYHTWPC